MVRIIDTTPQREIDTISFPLKKALRLNADNLLNGRVVAIDPGSTGSGYAIYVGGQVSSMGIIEPDPGVSVLHHRLQQIAEGVSRVTAGADIVVLEKIGAPNEKTRIKSYLPLIKSVGAILSSMQCKYMLELMPRTWQLFRDEGYEKKDDIDALYLGYAAIELARQLIEDDERYRGVSMPQLTENIVDVACVAATEVIA